MKQEAMVLPTSVGPLGTTLTLPDEEPKAIVLVVANAGGLRAGVNQLWVKFARAACESRVATVRADYAGTGESWDADPHRRFAAVRDLAHWACERTDDVPLLVVSHCAGLMSVVSVCRERAVAGAAVVLPPIFPAGMLATPGERPTVGDRVQATPSRVRALPRRLGYRMRYGSARPLWEWEQAERGHPVDDLCELVSRTPTWLLMGSDDICADPVRVLLPKLEEQGHAELMLLEGQALKGLATPDLQDAVCDHLADWVARSTSRLGAQA